MPLTYASSPRPAQKRKTTPRARNTTPYSRPRLVSAAENVRYRRDRGGLPNELRLSCGAELECSQTEFYNTVCTSVTGSVEHGRRQLQALVRQPAPAGLNPDQERCGRLRRQHQARSPALVKPGRSCVQKAVHRAGRPLV